MLKKISKKLNYYYVCNSYYIKYLNILKISYKMSSKMSSEINSKILIVKPIFVNDFTGEEILFYEEVGTPDFYMVSHTLKKHLGESWICIDKENPRLFTIEKIDEKRDRCIINTFENKEIIKKIYETNTLFPIWSKPSSHIRFEIMN
jgi:hypothetical protein